VASAGRDAEIERWVVERVLKLLGVEHVSADSIRHEPR
jgi:uncharacterized tellurite resistance protein B-like protein